MEQQEEASVDMYMLVYGLARAGLKIHVCLTELIDNCLDSHATRVLIEAIQGKRLRIVDNGDGIEVLKSLVRFGQHVAHRGAGGSGKYGRGFKDAALGLAGEKSTVRIRTVRDGKLASALIEWLLLKTTLKCMNREPPVAVPEPSGTTIEIEPLRMRFPEGKARQVLAEKLAYIYSPALEEGRRIELRIGGATVDLDKHRWRLPKFSEHLDEVVEIGGKRARLYAGIVSDGQENLKPGLTYTYKWRVIRTFSREGCGEHSTQKICGFVEVLNGWDRTVNKDDLVDAQDLYDEVERRMTPMLEKADRAAHHIEMDEGLTLLECALSEVLDEPSARAKRKQTGEKPGTVEPKNTGRKQRAANDTQPAGKVRSKAPKRCVKLEWCEGWKEGDPLGRYEVTSKVRAITMFQDHPYIARARQPWNAQSLLLAAITVLKLGPTMGQIEMLDTLTVSAAIAKSLAMPGLSFDGVAFDKAAE